MSKIVILGAGIAGHTAATHLRRKLGKEHEAVSIQNQEWIKNRPNIQQIIILKIRSQFTTFLSVHLRLDRIVMFYF